MKQVLMDEQQTDWQPDGMPENILPPSWILWWKRRN